MVSLTRYVFVLLLSVYLVPQVISQMYCKRPLQSCLNGGTCDPSTGQCHCSGAKGTLCQYLDKRYTEGTDTCKAALRCENGSGCLEANRTPKLCVCDMQHGGDLCDTPLYKVRCTQEEVEFAIAVESVANIAIAVVPFLHYDDTSCVILSDGRISMPGMSSGWTLLRGRAVRDPSSSMCYNAIITNEEKYLVHTLHYMIRYQELLRVSEYDSVLSIQCKFHKENNSDIQTRVEVRPFHPPDRKLDLHLRTATQGSFGDMKVLTSEGQPLPLQTALNVGDVVIIDFPFSQRQNLNDLTVAVMDIIAFPSDITFGIQPTILVENGCVTMPGAVENLEKSTNLAKVHLRAFRFRQSNKLHLVFNISACQQEHHCSCQDAPRMRRDATTGTGISAHSLGYTVTLKLKPLRESTRLAAPSFEGCLKTSEFSALLAMAAVATVAAVIALAVGGAVCFWSRDKK